ncbi:uncharacterized protein Z519_02724 [Cladophialophora bantiana CBS 173.52]|uniref:Uncharacterized protein n=1 Tax=Cladophialophora bantiana (strain ATCC 10958 / CBS 173.52 / CDC B-1940 / NIH 8579) TaxID=1442370 RepID=A0A0D2GG29_CLAB1|nr:uncharacterized protein Z519_02724 [Cladophialophora bantiana CBS 173.52]KIW97332.1 hypothetical protein Z519_02724 [Cladophialophora bantiana CBS 173.52]
MVRLIGLDTGRRKSDIVRSVSQVWEYDNYHMPARFSRLIPKWRKAWKEAEPWNDIVLHQVNQRLRRYMAGEKLDDFSSALMDDKSSRPRNLELGEFCAEVSVIINAGADTTAIALTNILDMLIRHPQHLDTLQEEVDGVLDDDEVFASYDEVKHLPFLRACIDESMRLIPPTSAALMRRTPPEGTPILGEWIPGDTVTRQSGCAMMGCAGLVVDWQGRGLSGHMSNLIRSLGAGQCTVLAVCHSLRLREIIRNSMVLMPSSYS